MVHKALLLFHLIGFVVFVGGGFAQQQFVKRSALAGVTPAIRDEYERLAATIMTRLELPGIFVQVATGVVFIALTPQWLTVGWLHAKLTCVAILLVLSHLEMINARKIVKARAARGDAAADEIAKRKSRHALFGAVGAIAVLAIVVLVAFGLG